MYVSFLPHPDVEETRKEITHYFRTVHRAETNDTTGTAKVGD